MGRQDADQLAAAWPSRQDDREEEGEEEGQGGGDGDGLKQKHAGIGPHRRSRKPKSRSRPNNPLQQGLLRFLHEEYPRMQLPGAHLAAPIDELAATLPKRYTVYKPLLLLPANVFSLTPQWQLLHASLSDAARRRVYECIVDAFNSSSSSNDAGITHIAMNAPIVPVTAAGAANIARSPTGLVPLLGDFGEVVSATATATTTTTTTAGGYGDGSRQLRPTEEELDRALWVQAVQNGGIAQVWAPLHTMFSRGNITEKARILGTASRFDGLDESGGLAPANISVVDMYAGIGYFVFSYLQRGVRRVWAFEINGWSVEGLRRGCRLNGWQSRTLVLGEADGRPAADLEAFVASLTPDDRVVIFHGSNEFALPILRQVEEIVRRRHGDGAWAPIRHVNLGLLPTSRAAWGPAVELLGRGRGGWAHVHENVDVREIDSHGSVVVARFNEHVAGLCGGAELQSQSQFPGDLTPGARAACCHVEQVKTYAPGVMHCVYDVWVPPIGRPAQVGGTTGQRADAHAQSDAMRS